MPKTFIGPWKLRSLIEFECGYSQSPGGEQETNQEQQLSASWPDQEANQPLYVYPVADLGAAVIFFGGRRFLVNVPEGTVNQLNKYELPSNIVLLSWEEAYTADLFEYCRQFSDDKLPSIWTSDWIWEEIQQRVQEQKCQNEEEERVKRQNEELVKKLGEKRVKFEKRHMESFAPQTNISMYYAVADADSPRLHAKIRLFGHCLTVRLDESKWGERLLPNLQEYQQMCQRIYEDFPQASERLKEAVGQRLNDLADDREDARSDALDAEFHYTIKTKVLKRMSDNATVSVDELCPPQIKENGFDAAVLQTQPFSSPQQYNKAQVVNLDEKLPLPPAEPDETIAASAAAASKHIYLAVGCGGLSTRSGGDITPDRRLLIGLIGIGQRNISLLGMKVLDFLDALKKRTFEKTLLLMVSPWTEADVRKEIARLRSEYKDLWEQTKAEVKYIRQTVIPRHKFDKGWVYYRQPNDSSFQFNPTGHFDLLRAILEDHSLNELNLSDENTFIYYSNYNNLGRNIDGTVSSIADEMLKQENCALLFELTPHFVKGEAQGEGSYWVNVNGTKRLLKPVYCGQDISSKWEGNRDKVVDSKQGLYMSTGSVLIHPKRLKDSIKDIPFYVRKRPPLVHPKSRQRSGSTREDTLQFERDIDQVSVIVPDCCKGVVVKIAKGGKSRFFPIKEEKDLSKVNYDKLVQLYDDINTIAPRPDIKLPRCPYILIGKENHAPWGGSLIPLIKGQLPPNYLISESHDLSIYGLGVSEIQWDALQEIPLIWIVESGEINLMAKLLDCNDWLSIQAHPNQWICNQIGMFKITSQSLKDLQSKGVSTDILNQLQSLNKEITGSRQIDVILHPKKLVSLFA